MKTITLDYSLYKKELRRSEEHGRHSMMIHFFDLIKASKTGEKELYAVCRNVFNEDFEIFYQVFNALGFSPEKVRELIVKEFE